MSSHLARSSENRARASIVHVVSRQYITVLTSDLNGVAVGEDESIVSAGAFYDDTVDGPSNSTVMKISADGSFMWDRQVSLSYLAHLGYSTDAIMPTSSSIRDDIAREVHLCTLARGRFFLS